MTSPPCRSRPLPDWGPADLAAALAPGPAAIFDGLTTAGGRPVALVAWHPEKIFDTLDDAGLQAATIPAPSAPAPALLFAVLGALAWNGRAHFWQPGAAAVFDPARGVLWHRGELPPVQPAAKQPSPALKLGAHPRRPALPRWPQADYEQAVRRGQTEMAAGGLDKLVLSVPFDLKWPGTPLTAYRLLTAEKPPGLRFLIDTGPAGTMVGVTPETLVTLTGRRAEVHPLAGTRPATAALTAELTASPKDRIEHTVSVEAACRDLQAVCLPDSVAVESFMELEEHRGVVHLASKVAGILREGIPAADLIRACFPAGTVGGVPRQAAAAAIAKLEPWPRGWYAGALGALMPGGDVRFWLTIRYALFQGNNVTVQTGAGLVADSNPTAEWQEIVTKANLTLKPLGAEVRV